MEVGKQGVATRQPSIRVLSRADDQVFSELSCMTGDCGRLLWPADDAEAVFNENPISEVVHGDGRIHTMLKNLR